MPIIKESLKRLWNADEMRILVLVSLSLQFGLVFLSPLRKRTSQKFLKLVLWFFYLFADYVAILAIGNLLRRQNVDAGGIGLMAFWAPFLLLHLGGPDTITSFSLEDNELWWRHFLGLIVQVVVSFIVLLELVAIPRLRVAAALVFIAGLVKYLERTLALRSSSMDQLKEHKQGRYAGQKTLSRTPWNEPQPSIIVDAFGLFINFMPLVADLRLIFRTQGNIEYAEYFRDRGVRMAFKMVDMELSFLYDMLHTKAILINGPHGFLWRFASLGMIFPAFILFLKSEKRGYTKADIIISYVLLGSALFMELISLLLIIFSDWMIIALEQKEHRLLKNLAVIIAKVMSCFLFGSKPRWSKSMGQYSLLNISLRDENTIIRRILGELKVENLWDNFFFIHDVPVPGKLEEILYEWSIRMPFEDFQDYNTGKLFIHEGENVLPWRDTDVEFDECILRWHIATDLHFHPHGARNDNNRSHADREISLIISNYMVYLLIMQPSMMPDGIGKIRFQETCAAVKSFYHVKMSGRTEEEARNALLDYDIIEHETNTWSVLSDACKLARQLNRYGEDERWGIISRAWVDMLFYAAINCKTYNHAKQLSQGGEFLTHVYLLMVQCVNIPEGYFPRKVPP
ncbi:uncharacterized protein LOC144548850 [Carex rostrata]